MAPPGLGTEVFWLVPVEPHGSCGGSELQYVHPNSNKICSHLLRKLINVQLQKVKNKYEKLVMDNLASFISCTVGNTDRQKQRSSSDQCRSIVMFGNGVGELGTLQELQ